MSVGYSLGDRAVDRVGGAVGFGETNRAQCTEEASHVHPFVQLVLKYQSEQ